jgi:hypothetical protein
VLLWDDGWSGKRIARELGCGGAAVRRTLARTNRWRGGLVDREVIIEWFGIHGRSNSMPLAHQRRGYATHRISARVADHGLKLKVTIDLWCSFKLAFLLFAVF